MKRQKIVFTSIKIIMYAKRKTIASLAVFCHEKNELILQNPIPCHAHCQIGKKMF